MKTVFKASTIIEANIVKGMLESYDIPASIQGEHMASAYGGLVPGLDVRVQVDDDDEVRATRVIKEYQDNEQDPE